MTTIWLEEGCIACGACVDCAPEIFAMDAGDGCLVSGAARSDGKDGDNRAERSPLRPEVADANAEAVAEAIAECPTQCIKSA
ncbi:MAG: ferredoxin [Planctomycetes bacterium]|nr:ferredoxin [Planctomycetota bacterium]